MSVALTEATKLGPDEWQLTSNNRLIVLTHRLRFAFDHVHRLQSFGRIWRATL